MHEACSARREQREALLRARVPISVRAPGQALTHDSRCHRWLTQRRRVRRCTRHPDGYGMITRSAWRGDPTLLIQSAEPVHRSRPRYEPLAVTLDRRALNLASRADVSTRFVALRHVTRCPTEANCLVSDVVVKREARSSSAALRSLPAEFSLRSCWRSHSSQASGASSSCASARDRSTRLGDSCLRADLERIGARIAACN
jgi:hypothetical protein